MSTLTDIDTAAVPLRLALAGRLAAEGLLDDPGWRRAVETVPRHRFVPGFYLERDQPAENGLPVWEPVTRADPGRWLTAANEDQTLITQLDGEEPDWDHPAPRVGGAPTSSSTLPSLVMRMWADADLREGHTVLEIGTGTGYSTALACERLGDRAVTSIEVDPSRLDQAAASLHHCGYFPGIAVADGLYGYAPHAPYDRIVAACSVRTIPAAWVAQTRPGGKILTTLSGWLYGYARVLLTVGSDGTATGNLLPGMITFMSARADNPPVFGNPFHWDAMTSDARPRPVRHTPDRLGEATEEAFYARFIAQLAAPNAQMITIGGVTFLVDVVTGSAATVASDGGSVRVRQAGAVLVWDAVEAALDAWDEAGRPGPDQFRMRVGQEQRIECPSAPGLSFVLPR